jgi:peptidoglycan hydrolase-like protein with peptidoglycan-binding domain
MIDTPSSKPRRSTIWVAALVLLAVLAPLVVVLAPRSSDADSRTTLIHRGEVGEPRIGLIGDSSLSGVRWYGTYGDLFQLNFVFDAESCRRTSLPSCSGREGYAPENGIQTIRRLRGKWGRVLVMVTGYNDPGYQFGEAVDAVVSEAKQQRIRKVMWLTMRTADVSYVSPEYRSDSYTFRDNNRILLQKAVQYRGYLQIADWATYSAQRDDWVAADGVHMTVAGGYAITSFIVQQARRVIAGHTVTPPPDPAVSSWVPLRLGDFGARVLTLQRALINRGIDVVGGADGAFGTYTERAVKTFQRRQGLAASGVVDALTAERLGFYQRRPTPGQVTCKVSVPLRPGDQLGQVGCLERHLLARGYRLDADRRYGPATGRAITYFKAVSGLRPDRRAGVNVYRALGIYRAPPGKPPCRISRGFHIGDRLPSVRCLKRHLRARGYSIEVSPKYGFRTVIAVRHWRRHMGKAAIGTADVATLRRMGAYIAPRPRPPCSISRTLRPGQFSGAVLCFERHLAARGYGISANKYFDDDVAMIVRHLKIRRGLPANAVVGRALLTKLGIFTRRPAPTRYADPPPSTTTTVPPTSSTTIPDPTAPVAPTTTAPVTDPSTTVPVTDPTTTAPVTEPSTTAPTTAPPTAPPTSPP